ncbi:MAG: succinyl-diaminopimelate desuccinylase, partial [Arthrobacter sp.]
MDIESVSGNEAAIADAVEAALQGLDHLEVVRDGDSVMARTNLGRSERVILAGHLDTVPLPSVPG